MLNITRLLCGQATSGDGLRYGEQVTIHNAPPPQARVHHRPVVVWNTTKRCNLHCIHCYMSSQDKEYPNELTTQEGLALIDDLADFGVPVLLLSGGEPLMRPDLFQLIDHATERGLRVVLSTNGTRITPEVAQKLKTANIQYVGISIDGLQPTNDRFRGKKGAFQEAFDGIRNTRDAGIKVGLRFTITRFNYQDLEQILNLAAQEVQRLCIYHLVYAGRAAKKAVAIDLTPQETRQAMDLVFAKTQELHQRGIPFEMLSVDNHADAPYLYLNVLEHQPERADEVITLLRRNGGNSTGEGIVCVDNLGNIHPDQFWQHYTAGNVRQAPLSHILSEQTDPLLQALKQRDGLIHGRCADCRFYGICRGNLRVRAEAIYNDVWAPDPACYLTDEEIGLPVAAASRSS